MREVRRVGAAISAEQIDDIVRSAALAPVEGDRKVMILDEFHLLDAGGAARLLKTLEEPPASTMFVVLADQVDDELVTIASRCVRIEFAPIDEPSIRDALIAEGIPTSVASAAAASAAGNPTGPGAPSDPGPAGAAQRSPPSRDSLMAPGLTVVTLADEITRLADQSAASLTPCTPPRRPRLTNVWLLRASAAAAASRSRIATSASCADTAPTSSAAASA